VSLRREQEEIEASILQALKRRGELRWTQLEKHVMRSCSVSVSSYRFRLRMQYLLQRGFVERVRKGVYRITEKGEKYLSLLDPLRRVHRSLPRTNFTYRR